MSVKAWYLVFGVFFTLSLVLGAVGLRPFLENAKEVRKNPLKYLWLGLGAICLGVCTLAHFKFMDAGPVGCETTHGAGVRGEVRAFIIWILLVVGMAIGLRSLIGQVCSAGKAP